MTLNHNSEYRVAIGGLGSIGKAIANHLDKGIPGLKLVAVSAKNLDKAQNFTNTLTNSIKIRPIEALANYADIIIECAPINIFDKIANPSIKLAKIFIPLTVSALLTRPSLIKKAKQNGSRIIVPTGALIGLDAVRAAAEGKIHSAKLITRKPPLGLKGAPYLKKNNITLEGLKSPVKIFEGTALEATEGFPANVNVVAALSLAGIGAKKTKIEIWADPQINRNIQSIKVSSDSSTFEATIENIPSQENPSTGSITALSVIATLRSLISSLRVGT